MSSAAERVVRKLEPLGREPCAQRRLVALAGRPIHEMNRHEYDIAVESRPIRMLFRRPEDARSSIAMAIPRGWGHWSFRGSAPGQSSLLESVGEGVAGERPLELLSPNRRSTLGSWVNLSTCGRFGVSLRSMLRRCGVDLGSNIRPRHTTFVKEVGFGVRNLEARLHTSRSWRCCPSKPEPRAPRRPSRRARRTAPGVRNWQRRCLLPAEFAALWSGGGGLRRQSI